MTQTEMGTEARCRPKPDPTSPPRRPICICSLVNRCEAHSTRVSTALPNSTSSRRRLRILAHSGEGQLRFGSNVPVIIHKKVPNGEGFLSAAFARMRYRVTSFAPCEDCCRHVSVHHLYLLSQDDPVPRQHGAFIRLVVIFDHVGAYEKAYAISVGEQGVGFVDAVDALC